MYNDLAIWLNKHYPEEWIEFLGENDAYIQTSPCLCFKHC
jgi:hypothetical protein